MNVLNAIPLSIMLAICCSVSYFHGYSGYGSRIHGLVYTIIMGICATILVVVKPIFL